MVIKNIFFTQNSFFRSNKKIKNKTYKELRKFIDEIKFNNEKISLGDLTGYTIASTIPISELVKCLKTVI